MNTLYALSFLSLLACSFSCNAMEGTVCGPAIISFDAGSKGSVDVKAQGSRSSFYASGNRGAIELPEDTFDLTITPYNCTKKMSKIISITSLTGSASDQESGSEEGH